MDGDGSPSTGTRYSAYAPGGKNALISPKQEGYAETSREIRDPGMDQQRNTDRLKGEERKPMEPGTVLLVIIGAAFVLLLLDLMLAGGAMTGGMMTGMMAAASNPFGAALLLVILGLAALFAYVTWFA